MSLLSRVDTRVLAWTWSIDLVSAGGRPEPGRRERETSHGRVARSDRTTGPGPGPGPGPGGRASALGALGVQIAAASPGSLH